MKRYFYPLVGFLCVILFTSCARKIHFNTSSVVPAATGTIKIDKDNNGNYSINVSVLHLAEPDKLNPPKSLYLVWLATKEHGQKNLGQLTISSGLLSKTLKGSLKTVTPYEPVSIYVTAEEDAAKSYPGPQVVLTAEINK